MAFIPHCDNQKLSMRLTIRIQWEDSSQQYFFVGCSSLGNIQDPHYLVIRCGDYVLTGFSILRINRQPRKRNEQIYHKEAIVYTISANQSKTLYDSPPYDSPQPPNLYKIGTLQIRHRTHLSPLYHPANYQNTIVSVRIVSTLAHPNRITLP